MGRGNLPARVSFPKVDDQSMASSRRDPLQGTHGRMGMAFKARDIGLMGLQALGELILGSGLARPSCGRAR